MGWKLKKAQQDLPWKASLLTWVLGHSVLLHIATSITHLVYTSGSSPRIYMQIVYICLSPQNTHSNVSLPCFLNLIYLGVCSVSVHKECPYSILWLHRAAWNERPWVCFKNCPVLTQRNLSCGFCPSSLSIWPGQRQLKEGCPFPEIRRAHRSDYEWDWLDGSEWQRQRAELVEPHAGWRSLAGPFVIFICCFSIGYI